MSGRKGNKAEARRRSLGLALAFVLGAALAVAAPLRPALANFTAEQLSILKGINQYFNAIRTMEGDFIQFGPYGDQSEGVFFLERPGKIRFHYRPPVRVDLIADGRSVLVRDMSAKTEDLYPLNRTPLRYLLAANVDLTSQTIVKQVVEEQDLFSVVLDDNNNPADGKITLIFDKLSYELRQWVITDPQGLDTSVAIYNVETGKPANPTYFRIYLQNPSQLNQ